MSVVALPFSSILVLNQLRHMRRRLVGAFAGVCVAIVLVFTQIGLVQAVVGSALNLPRAFDADVVITAAQYESSLFSPPWLPMQALLNARSVPGVDTAWPFYMLTDQVRDLSGTAAVPARFAAFDPARPVLSSPALGGLALPLLALPRAVLLDSRSRNRFEPIAASFARWGPQKLYLQRPASTLAPEIEVVGLYALGPDFTLDGALVTSDLNFHRLFGVPLDRITYGMVRTRPGFDAEAVRGAIEARNGSGARAFTRDEFLRRERDFVLLRTPIGAVLGFGLLVGVAVGIIFMVQVLHSVVDANLSEYAVLRTMGFGSRFFVSVVLQTAAVIGAVAFLPSLGLTVLIYAGIRAATKLSCVLSGSIVLVVLGLVLLMCGISALASLRKLLRSSPLDLFA